MNPEDQKLAKWVRETLFFDVEEGIRDDAAAQHILDEVYRRRDAENLRRTQRRRRLRWGAAVGGAVAVVGGAAVAAVIGFGQPSHPESGTLCRAGAELGGDGVVIAPGEDPIAGCERVWSGGQFGTSGTVPPLTACIGSNGAVEVFPAGSDVCERLGLSPADRTLSEANVLILMLQERLSSEINLGECQPVPEVAQQARVIVDESGIDGWQVVIEPGSEAGVCGKAAVDSATSTVTVHEF